MDSSYRQKFYLHAGVNVNGTGSANNLTVDNALLFSGMGIAEDGVQHLGSPYTLGSYNYGYLNDGPVPLTSQLLDLQNAFGAYPGDVAHERDLIANSGPDGGSNSVTMYFPWIRSAIGTVAKYEPVSVGTSGKLGGQWTKLLRRGWICQTSFVHGF